MSRDDELTDLRGRVTRLEAIHEVEATVQRYVRAYDSRDEALLRRVFAEDAVLVMRPGGRWEGWDEIVGLYRDIWADRSFLNHHVTNQVVDVTGDAAVVTSYYLVAMEDAGGQPMRCGGFYERHLERRDGNWVQVHLDIEIEYLHAVDGPSFRAVVGEDEARPAPQDNPHHPLPLFPDR